MAAKRRVATGVTLKVLGILLVTMGAGLYVLVSHQTKRLEQQLLERGKIMSLVGAKMYGRVLEGAVDTGVFSLQDTLRNDYKIIPGFDPPKYHTAYDTYLDNAVLAFQDEMLKDESVLFAVGVDATGYLPTHNSKYQQPITGDRQKDLVGNRTKRIFNDPVGAAAAKNTQEGFLQDYHRDTGERAWDVSSPIYVKGKHWGGFRLGLSLKKIEQAKTQLVTYLLGGMFVVLLVAALGIVLTVNLALKPLSRFTQLASDFADGDVDQPIQTDRQDEIGELADVLERLRLSLKAAMERLAAG